MELAVQEMNAHGTALSALYPATLPLYRRAGYEQAGSKYEVKLSLRMLDMSERNYQVRPIEQRDEAALKAVYGKRAAASPGFLDRSDFIWKRIRAPRGEAANGYAAVNPQSQDIEGYLYYSIKESQDAAYLFSLTDLTATTPQAARRLLTFLREHQSMADLAVWQGGAIDPVLQVLPERIAKIRLTDHWMLRIIDVGAALNARGYPFGLNCELHLDVQDDVIVSNNGRYVLEIADGKANVSTGGDGHLLIDVRGLAALYSGFMSASQLQMSGLASTSNPRVLPVADAVFAGGAPSLCDGF
jgi:predicted acetyltransferase